MFICWREATWMFIHDHNANILSCGTCCYQLNVPPQMFSDLTMKSEFHIAAAATGWRLEVERKNSSDEHILIVLVTQSYYATSDDSWPLTFDPSGHFKEGIQEKNSHNRPDCSKAIDSVGDGRAVEYYFASDARSDTNCLWVLWWIWGKSLNSCHSLSLC